MIKLCYAPHVTTSCKRVHWDYIENTLRVHWVHCWHQDIKRKYMNMHWNTNTKSRDNFCCMYLSVMSQMSCEILFTLLHLLHDLCTWVFNNGVHSATASTLRSRIKAVLIKNSHTYCFENVKTETLDRFSIFLIPHFTQHIHTKI